ncbi:MAG: hypothetical protein LC113_10750 [Acidobacteria bacterium]|nr:hypothetical protein [Acidobacteriota bacterium]
MEQTSGPGNVAGRACSEDPWDRCAGQASLTALRERQAAGTVAPSGAMSAAKPPPG